MDPSPESPLWNFTLRLYRKPGVPAACLDIQDRHQADVTLLIYAIWVGTNRHVTLDMGQVAAASAAVAEWHSEIVRPLRAIRRRMKTGPAPAPDTRTEALRDMLKAVELDAERLELAVLEALAPPKAPGATALPVAQTVRQNLRAMLRPSAGPDLPDATATALELLVQAAAEL